MKKNQLIIAGVLSVFVAILVGAFMASLESKYRKGAQKVTVLVASRYIDQGLMVSEDMVKEVQMPREYVQPKAIAALADILGKEKMPQYMTIVPVMEGEQILGSKLLALGAETGLASVVPSEFRAMTFLLDRQEVQGIIRPGNKVDVIGVFDYYGEGGTRREEAVTLIQNVTVLAVGKAVLGSMEPVTMKKGRVEAAVAAEAPESVVTVSLAVTPTEAETVALAKKKGEIFMSLRPIGDERIYDLPGAALSKIFRAAPASRPAAPVRQSAVVIEAERQTKEALEMLKRYQRR
ncbi:MAG: Flp pilus assembly protein CpaB [Endomicrobiia bacterium]|nr:Flp pilus assembly protein CpaB [Endomicrobiia bacterium]